MRFGPPLLLLGAVLAGCGGPAERPLIAAANAAQTAGPPPPAPPPPLQAAPGAESRRTAIVTATQRIAPSVVSIHATARRQVETPAGLWDFFFIPQAREQVVESFGTGFILRADGLVVTNQHVVADVERLTVTLSDGTELDGRLLGADPTSDVAVLKVDRTGLPVPPIGQSSDLAAGEWVVALGNPYAYLLGNSEPTVTAGVVSATGRNILPNREQTGLYLDMIQTDAAINPGNSGGPLANALGDVVGMNSSILSTTGGSIGLGFAIPIERVVRVANEIVRQGGVRRAWLGLDVAGAEAMRDWKSQGGVAVTRVAPGGPADQAGLESRAILVAANGRRLRNFLDWEAVKLDLRVGDTVAVEVRRQGARAGADRTVTRRLRATDLPTVTAPRVSVLQGLELITVTPAVRSERGLRAERGALIVRITGQLSGQTGLAQDDVIIAINRTPTTSAEQVARLLQGAGSREALRIHFERGGQVGYTDLAFR